MLGPGTRQALGSRRAATLTVRSTLNQSRSRYLETSVESRRSRRPKVVLKVSHMAEREHFERIGKLALMALGRAWEPLRVPRIQEPSAPGATP